jgi:hypothetical protein
MAHTANTTTSISGVEDFRLHFSGDTPSYSIASSSAELDSLGSQEILDLQSELGQSALALAERDNQIEQLKAQIADLKSQSPRSIEASVEKNPILNIVGAALNGAGIEAEIQDPEDKKEVHAEIIIPGLEETSIQDELNGHAENDPDGVPVTTPELTPSQQRYEKTITYLLTKNDFAVKGPNAGGILRQALGIEHGDWGNLRAKLHNDGIIYYVKDETNPKRLIEIGLIINAVADSTGKAYITADILELLKEKQASTEVTPDIVQPNKDTSNNSTSVQPTTRPISARVRRALEIEPLPLSGQRDRGKKPSEITDHPFLGSRQLKHGGNHN